MFLQHQDILALLSSPQGLLKQLDSQLVSIKRQVPYHPPAVLPSSRLTVSTPAVSPLSCLTLQHFQYVPLKLSHPPAFLLLSCLTP